MQSDGRQVFMAKTMAQALVAMKSTLGPDALLISKRKVKKGGILGIGAEELHEVIGERLPPWLAEARSPALRSGGRNSAPSHQLERTAREDRSMLSAKEMIAAAARGIKISRSAGRPPSNANGWIVDDDAAILTRTMPGAYDPFGKTPAPPRKRTSAASAQPDMNGLAELRLEFRNLKDELRAIVGGASAPAATEKKNGPPAPAAVMGIRCDAGALSAIVDRMVASGVPVELSREIAENVARRSSDHEADDYAVIRSRVAKEIGSRLKIAPPLDPSPDAPMIICCVGATGVGKTTTLAKLGSLFHEGEARSIAYLTLDNYRIAAIEQLRTYSDIQEVPFEEVTTARELADAIDRHIDKDVILIDTPGRSPYHLEAIDELKRILQELNIDTELLLLVSSTTDVRDMDHVIKSFSILDRVRLVFTKTDETMRWGSIFTAAIRSGLPLGFLTTGQSVPDDIEPANSVRIADALLGDAECMALSRL